MSTNLSGIIYLLTNKVNGKKYVGFTTDLADRMAGHQARAKAGTHNFILVNAINKHGWENFECTILAEHPDAEYAKNILEPQFIKEQDSFFENGKGYNMTLGGEGTLGYKRTPEQCKRMSERQKGKIVSEQTRKAISLRTKGEKNPNYGKTHGQETRKKISNGILKARAEGRGNRLWTEEQRRELSERKKGKKMSEEARKNMSLAQKGKPGHPHTEEHKKYMSELLKGREFSDETLKLMTFAHATFVWTILRGDGVLFETCNLDVFRIHFHTSQDTIEQTMNPNYGLGKRKSRRLWTGVSKRPITEEDRQSFIKHGCTWRELTK